MKKRLSGSAAVAQINLPKRTARDAEVELSHLETVFRSLSPSTTPAVFGPVYWRSRVAALDRHYMLLVPQRARLAALARSIDELETALAAAGLSTDRLRVAA
ncbi:conserved hypothetical protein [Burkholderia sp. 8Y]|uniref:hypothetical protein n=1 Tax=Burkholderia sp. 8Y TaxID=2653133 RepID=UPI0012F41FF0|nr:hypothetical protein [Burkholderia sp. 8Y]VXC83538.1 conserved hypothetical protein [Burkholderia sp. 8Y]